MTLTELSTAMNRGEVTCTQAIERSLRECARLQPKLNAFIRIDADAALSAGREVDARRASGELLGPLQGIPLAHKDIFDRRGHLCSFGSQIGQRKEPTNTATVIAHLEEAGSITLGALNLSEFALGPTGHNATFGDCRNPWNTARVSGGSSSGAGVAIAAGMICGAVGSDTGGSIRIPAACCGVVGLKPTHERVSRAGAMPLAPSLDAIGPLARTVEDCELIFRVIANDTMPLAHGFSADRKLRLLYPRERIASEVAEEIRAALDDAAGVFRQSGVAVLDGTLPDVTQLHDLADAVQKPESAAAHLDMLALHRAAYSRHVRRRIEPGFFITAAAYVHALNQRPRHLKAFVQQTLAGADALLIPALGILVPTIQETDEQALGHLPGLVTQLTRWTRWLNYLSVPALSIPCGFDRNQMPIGLQIVGRPHTESTLFAIGREFQRATAWHRQRPRT